MKVLNDEELNNVIGGEVVALTAVLACLAAAIVAVIVYRLFMSTKGTATIPGGWKFTWN